MIQNLQDKIKKATGKFIPGAPKGTVTVLDYRGRKIESFDVPQGFQLDRFVMLNWMGRPSEGEIEFKKAYAFQQWTVAVQKHGQSLPAETYVLDLEKIPNRAAV